MSLIISVKDALRQSVEGATGGRVTVLYDDQGYPNYMVRIPKFRVEDVVGDNSAGTGVHPAFIVNGTEVSEILIGQYQAFVHDNRALAIPGQDPTVHTDWDQAHTYCNNKGSGWHLMTNAEWAAIALWAWQNDSMPRGNNDYGRDHTATYETATRQDGGTPGDGTGDARVLTGSGPASWRHDGTPAGICDLNGNVWEWQGGMRLQDGEIQVLVDNDAADNTADQSAGSSAWMGIQADGSGYAAPGTSGNLYYDALGTGDESDAELDTKLDNQMSDPDNSTVDFENMAIDSGITAPNLAKQMGLYPAGTGLGGDFFRARNYGERVPRRGGGWGGAGDAGVFSLRLSSERSDSYGHIGFRPAFVAI